jgi:hypothetical protein
MLLSPKLQEYEAMPTPLGLVKLPEPSKDTFWFTIGIAGDVLKKAVTARFE